MTRKLDMILIIFLIIGIFIVDKFLWNETSTEEEIAHKRFVEENLIESEKFLKETIKIVEKQNKDYEEEEKQYKIVLEKNKELKAIIREHECGKDYKQCERDYSGNYLVYKDVAGVSTVCFGNTSFPRKNPEVTKVSDRKCEFLLDEDLDKKIAEFESTEIYKKHSTNLEAHKATKEMYIDLIFNAGLKGFMYTRNKDGTFSNRLTNMYKEALKDPFSVKATELVKSYSNVKGKKNNGLLKRRETMIALAAEEKEQILKQKLKTKKMSLTDYFDVYASSF